MGAIRPRRCARLRHPLPIRLVRPRNRQAVQHGHLIRVQSQYRLLQNRCPRSHCFARQLPFAMLLHRTCPVVNAVDARDVHTGRQLLLHQAARHASGLCFVVHRRHENDHIRWRCAFAHLLIHLLIRLLHRGSPSAAGLAQPTKPVGQSTHGTIPPHALQRTIKPLRSPCDAIAPF